MSDGSTETNTLAWTPAATQHDTEDETQSAGDTVPVNDDDPSASLRLLAHRLRNEGTGVEDAADALRHEGITPGSLLRCCVLLGTRQRR